MKPPSQPPLARRSLLGLLALCALALPGLSLQAAPGGSVVVFVQAGEIQVEGVDGVHKAPTHFNATPSQTLVLAAGARAALYNGSTTVVTGPAEVALSSLGNPAPQQRAEAAASTGLFDKRTSTARVGAARLGGAIEILRPVEGSILSLEGRSIRWRCTDCGPQDVILEDGSTGQELWRSRTESGEEYRGPALESGKTYLLRVDGGSVTLRTPAEHKNLDLALRVAGDIENDLRAQGVEDEASLMAPRMAAYEGTGYSNEALYALDDAAGPGGADVGELRQGLERRLGLTP